MNAGAADWPLYVGWGLTALGWCVASLQADDLQLRKEKRAEVDLCCRLIAGLLRKSRRLYSQSVGVIASHDYADLRFSAHWLVKRMQRLQRQHPEFQLKSAGINLLVALTGGNVR